MTRLHEDVLAQSMIRWLHNNRDLRETDPTYFKRLVKARARHMALDDDATSVCLQVFQASLNPPA